MRLREIYAERRQPIAFWVGAGLSRDAGLPTWQGLRQTLVAEALEKIATLDPADANRLENEISAIETTEDLWHAFSTIKRVLGDATYRQSIRSIFERADSAEIPALYTALWGLDNVSGLLNLNIDGLATRAHRRARPVEDIVSFVGKAAPDYAHRVAQRKPFIANLHGIHEAGSSWVFTREDINSLLGNPAYVNFMSFVFGNMSVVFMGISADDVAAGGFLSNLTQMGLDLGPHFWITDRRDAKTDSWANNAGLQPIRYEPFDNDHTSVLLDLIDDLKNFRSYDQKPPAILGEVPKEETLASPQELKLLAEDELRMKLSGYARSLIENANGATNTPEYQQFLNMYSPSIHQAWHVTEVPPYNRFFDHEIVERISSGPFSSVWKLSDREGRPAALKIIQRDNLRDGPQLESFRRGVNSLRIVGEAGIAGPARLREAYEIPTAVIMDYIEGDDLSEIVHSGSYKFWTQGIKIIHNLCSHIDKSHRIPDGVLHRDIRPSNVMVPHYYWGSAAQDSGFEQFDVRVLNYDMSWHKDAQGRTIAGNIQEAGYYAPEQLENRDGELARNAKVDTYGIGMTLYFAVAKKSPPIGGSKAADWATSVAQISPDRAAKWKSATQRLRRLILSATSVTADERPSVAEVGTALKSMIEANEGNLENLTPDMLAEEIFCRAIGGTYSAIDQGAGFTHEIRAGRTVTLAGSLSGDSIQLIFRNQATTGTDWTKIDKLWAKKLETARNMLTSQGWKILSGTRYSSQEIHLLAEISTKQAAGNLDRVASGLDKGLAVVRLD